MSEITAIKSKPFRLFKDEPIDSDTNIAIIRSIIPLMDREAGTSGKTVSRRQMDIVEMDGEIYAQWTYHLNSVIQLYTDSNIK